MTTTPPPPEPTDDEIRVRIAEACGIRTDVHECPSCHLYRGQGHTSFCTYIPNYLTDLNACAEFEKTLKGHQLSDYVLILGATVGRSKSGCHNFDMVTATARQRCLAFLATINGETQ